MVVVVVVPAAAVEVVPAAPVVAAHRGDLGDGTESAGPLSPVEIEDEEEEEEEREELTGAMVDDDDDDDDDPECCTDPSVECEGCAMVGTGDEEFEENGDAEDIDALHGDAEMVVPPMNGLCAA